ncbi:MAG: type II toxin-antitoxin system HicB family antitoxin [Oscillospiraceae bacterium]|nr:type II toxin-antitoxin system HicB family antitoxin [Oscillospiraceae bacterium]
MPNLPVHYYFPAVFSYHNDGISVTFPDLPGCVSYGENEPDAIKSAQQCLALHICGMEEDGDEIPGAASISEINLQKGEAIVLIDAFMPPVREHIQNSPVKKTLTIPKWLNEAAVARKVNFSGVLQQALMKELDIRK